MARPGIDRRAVLLASAGLLAAPALLRAQGAAPMQIGIIGSGNVGSAIGGRWVRAGHQVLFSSRNPERLAPLVAELGPRASAGTVAQAAARQVVFIAVPYAALAAIGRENAAALAGKVVLDACNAVAARDGAELARTVAERGVGATSAEYLPGARVVRAFNSFGARIMRERAGQEPLIGVPVGVDDPEARTTAIRLVRDAGFEPVDVPLARAREFAPGGPLFGQALPAAELRSRLGVAG